MSEELSRATGAKSPTMFRQIATRLAAFTLLFALLDVGLVVFTYISRPESLAQELLTLEAGTMEAANARNPALFSGPPGAQRWTARFIEPGAGINSLPFDLSSAGTSTLVDWTRRDKTEQGYQISGVRMVKIDGHNRWLLMEFEGDGMRPYFPVIANEIIQHVALPLLPLSVMLLLFNIVAVRRVLKPLRQAELEIDALDPDNMLMRLSEAPAPREVNALVNAFNRALSRLDEAMTTLREFTANAAHELRTPLSIMQLSLDKLPPSELRNELQEDSRDLSRMVSQMLDLAQADALAIEPDCRVDLADIGREVVTAIAPKVFEAGRDIRFEVIGDTKAIGHAEAIFRIYRNLIDNAMAHSAGATPIEVCAGPGPQISVRDYGRGIAEEDIPHIFERFWRKERRSSDGAGLGLGIVLSLTQAHGGTITADNAVSGGAIFTVTFVSPPK